MLIETIITRHKKLIELQRVFTSTALFDTVRTFSLRVLSIFSKSQKMQALLYFSAWDLIYRSINHYL